MSITHAMSDIAVSLLSADISDQPTHLGASVLIALPVAPAEKFP